MKINHDEILRSYLFTEYEKLTNSSHFLSIRKIQSKNNEYYRFIPSNTFYAIDLIQEISNTSNVKKFIDIGCGFPIIPLLVNKVFKDVECSGLEYNSNIFKYLQLFGLKDKKKYNYEGIDILKGDLLEYDFSKYDVLYSYNPIANEELMVKGLKNIIKTMKMGAILYFNNAGVDNDKLNKLGLIKHKSSLFKFVK